MKIIGKEVNSKVIIIIFLLLSTVIAAIVTHKQHEWFHDKIVLLLENQNWQDAYLALEDKKNCSECFAMGRYALAKRNYSGWGDNVDGFIAAREAINAIDDDYNGLFSKEIKEYKGMIDEYSSAAMEEIHKKDEARKLAIKEADKKKKEEEARKKAEREAEEAKRKAKKEAEEAEEREYRESHLYVGDPESKIQKVLGDPYQVNRTVIAGHTLKQYVYDRGYKFIFVYTEDGTVTGFQD